MRIAFVGGKACGKSTCAAVFSRHLAARGLPVLAVDAADGRLAALLGRPTPPRWVPVEGMFGLAPDGLVGLTHTVGGPRTPPAMRVGTARCASAVAADGVHLVATDAHEALLDHLADGPGEYVVVDLAVDGNATARYDLTVLVGNCSGVARCRATPLRWSVPTRRAGGRSSCGLRSAPRWPR